jgi:hypothetical protein
MAPDTELTREQEVAIIAQGLHDRQPEETDADLAGRIVDALSSSQPKYQDEGASAADGSGPADTYDQATDRKIIATFAANLTIRQVEDDPANAAVQTPTVAGIEKVITEAVQGVWPWLTARVDATRTDK